MKQLSIPRRVSGSRPFAAHFRGAICAAATGLALLLAVPASAQTTAVERVTFGQAAGQASQPASNRQQAQQAAQQQAPVQSLASPPAQQVQPGRPMSAPTTTVVTQPRPQPYPNNSNMPAPTLSGGPVDLVNEGVERIAPLTPAEIRRMKQMLGERTDALSENMSGRPPAKPMTQIYNLDLSPGATPPVIRVEVGQGSIVSFVDASGKPWPCRFADGFNPKKLSLTQFTEHQLSISTNSPTPINVGVAVALEGLATPITFSVLSGQPAIDAQVKMVVPQFKDGAPPDLGSMAGQPSLNASNLNLYLLRTPPKEARALNVEGAPGVMAWQISASRMVVRSSAKVVSGYFRGTGPAGIGDGTEVYEMPLSPKVFLVQGDKYMSATFSGFTVGGGSGGDK